MRQYRNFYLILLVLLAGLLLGIGVSFINRERVKMFFTDRYVTSVDKVLPSLRKADIVVYGLSAESVGATAYEKKGEVKKVSARFYSEMGKVERDYYYDHGALRFVLERDSRYASLLGEVKKVEESWLYFDRHTMTAWLFGPNKQEKAHDLVYGQQEQDIRQTSDQLLTALAPRLAWQRAAPQSLKQFLPNKVFLMSCMSGEQGTFRADGTLPVSWGHDYVTDDNRPSKATGRWEATGEAFTLQGTTLSDETYNSLFFETSDGKTVVRTYEEGCGLIIGPDYKTIKEYEDTFLYYYEIYADSAMYFILTLPESWIGKYVVSYADYGEIFHYKKEDGTKNILFDIIRNNRDWYIEKEGETLLWQDDDVIWVGRPRPPEASAYDGPDKEEFERMLADVPAILTTFGPPSGSTEE